MANPKISTVPPADDDDEVRLRRVLGSSVSQTKAAPPAVPQPLPEPLPPTPAKVTVSVRMAPSTQAGLAAIGQALGWTSNRIMTALVEHQARVLRETFEREGREGVLKHLLDQ